MNELFKRIQSQVLNTPEKIILSSIGDEKNITYRELDLLSGKVYRYLKDHGIGREDFVNIILPRGVEPFIAMLGVWKAGAAFVLLEQEYPAERIAFIRKDCGCKLVIDSRVWEEILQCESIPGFADVDDHDAAFAVYTSGTTGNPKGVLHEYGNLDIIAQSIYENGESLMKIVENFALIAPLYFVAVVTFYICLMDVGGRLSVVPFSITKNPPALLKVFVENKVNALFCAPSILHLMRKIPKVKRIFVGSEPANGIWSDDPGLSIINAYAMSETAFCITMGHLDKPNEIAPVGKPLTNLKITLRDEEGKPVPEGKAGELCVENPFVRGYINRPEDSAVAFVNGEFHTRDIARMLPDGQYEIIGRIDDMIKINGNRVEPAEVEAAVKRVSGLERVVAAGFGEGIDTFICCYYADPVELDTEELREKLESVLPYYMIPSRFVHLDDLPRTATGKVSRRLLPKPVAESAEYVAPANDMERAMCDAMARALGIERFGAEDDFYALGGNSITSIEVVGTCGLPGLSINQIFRGRTPKKTVKYYLEELSLEKEAEGDSKNLARPCPLTQSQLGIFLECERREGEAAYNNPLLFSLPCDTDPELMTAAIEKMVRAHPGLFAGIVSDEHGIPAMQYQSAFAEQEICVREQMTGEEFEKIKKSLVQPFDIKNERLFRIRLIGTEAVQYLFMDFHHLVFDGTSMQILAEDLEKALNGEDISPESWTAYDAAMAEQGARQNMEAWNNAKEWNLKQFGDADPTSLPEGDRKGSGMTYGDQSFTLDISYGELKAFCEKQMTTENVLTTAAFGYLLSAYTLKKDVLFTSVYNGRRDPRCHRTVSMFVTTLPVLCHRGGDLSVAEYLSALKEQMLGSMANDLYSFAELSADTGITSDVQFVWQADMLSLPKGSTLKLKREKLPFIATGDALSVQLFPEEDKLVFQVQYHADRYSEEYIARFAGCMNQVLKDMMVKNKLLDISLISDEERNEILTLSKGEELHYDAGKTWLDHFRLHVMEKPDKKAVIDNRGSYTYSELDKVSDAVASYLIAMGVDENHFVAVKMGHVKEFVPAIIGIQKAGAAYVPVDPEYPKDRIDYMLEDSEAKVVLTEELLADIIAKYKDVESINRATPAHRAYMIYTSGSTGRPKGVVQSHRSLCAFATWRQHVLHIGQDSIHALHPTFSFDASLDDLICPLFAGGEVHIFSDELRRDMTGMAEYIREHHINGLTMSTQIGMAMVNQYPDLPLRYIMMGGEKMLPCAKTGIRLINGYGPTEFTVCSSLHVVDQNKDTDIPIGRPVPNTWSFICDAYGKLMPQGMEGELCLAGPQVAEGYWKKKELTEEKFVPCTFVDGVEMKMYRTGDLVRYNEEGDLEFLGRIDTQVKLRGFRIEPGEIEAAASHYKGIAQVAALVCDDHLVLYYTGDGQIDQEALRGFLAESLAEYLVPGAYKQLDSMPMTPNGKIDRKTLQKIPATSDELIVPPENETEQMVSDLVKEVLAGREIGVTAEFLKEGLTSLAAMRLSAMIATKFEKDFKISYIKEFGTIRKIAEYLNTDTEEERFEQQQSYPITTVQQGIYVECMANFNTTIYNTPVLLKLDEEVDIFRLKQAISEAVDAHPYLKMRLSLGDEGRIAAWRRDDDKQQVSEVNLETVEHGFEGLVRPFNLTGDCLFRTMIIHDGEDHYLFLDGQHIVIDGESMEIFMRDLNRAYAGETLTKERFTGFEAALVEDKLRHSSHYDHAKEYYEGLLEGIDTDCLPIYDRDLGKTKTGQLTIVAPFDWDRLSAVVKDGSVTLNGLWNAAFGLALARFLYREDCVYTTVYNGRNDTRLSDSVGMFVHTLPVVCHAQKNENGMEFARRMSLQLSDSMANDIFSFAEISKAFQLKTGIIFVYQGRIGSEPMIGGKKAESIMLDLNALKAPLTINILEKEDGFEIFSEYDSRYYEEWSVRALLGLTVRILEQLLADRKISEISLVTPEEKQELDAFNSTEKAVETTDIVTLFRRAAKRYPHRRAAIFKEKTLSYRELDELTDRVAAHLMERGIGAGDIVAILIPRSEYMAITALGVLKTGAAYQPLDPAYPTERLKIMVEDSKAKALIEDEMLKDRLPDYKGEVLLIHEIGGLPDRKPVEIQLGPDALFILLYTSGTTGVPKGVMLTHGNLVNFCQWYRDYFELTEDSAVSAYASFGFDACMMDMYPALTTGASVCIVPEDMRLNLPELDAYFAKNQVTHAFLTTQMARMFATTMTGTKVKYLMGGGEKLVPFSPEGSYRFYNGYGPTECTIFSSTFPVEENTFRVPIGKPLDNYKIYVVGKDGYELPVGVPGELWIAGYGVGKGYFNKPELTEKAFISNPFCDAPGYDRVYRTGDIVRRLPDGSIDFIGRNDGQVKIRGFRIELSEVESVIRMYEGIKDATVQAFDSPSGGKYIAAYYVADQEIDEDDLTEFIKNRKPEYMVPSAFVQIDAIPLTQNQKVNKKMLPVPEIRNEGKEYTEPATPLERELCEEFAKILGISRVGAEDDFFESGGSSILAANLLTYAMGKGYNIVYNDIFNHPTPRKLATVIEGTSINKMTDEVSGYDYSRINSLIAANAMGCIDDISREPLGDVVLTGATGFLGIHILQQFLEKSEGRITCLMRKVRWGTLENHLKSLLMYYFGNTYEELFGNRIFCLEGDITDTKSLLAIDSVKADVIINCAANVKHFVIDDVLDRINFHGVENLIEVCLKNHMRLVQVSTLSVGGTTRAGQKNRLYENDLYLGQRVDNDYIRTKFLAERAILEARVERGLDAVILRAGNLMGRYSDGEFQINFLTNAFMRSLAAFNRLGACPVTALADTAEFSPIDATASAMLALAGVNSKFSIFNVNNNHTVTRGDIIFALNRHGFKIDIVTEKEFAEIVQKALEDESYSESVMALTAYEEKEDNIVPVESDNYFTINALYRLGFKWPIVDDTYLEKVISAVESLNFFKNL